MSLTTLALVAPGDIITSAQQNIVRTNFGVLDARTGGDPGSTSLIAVSNGAASSIWTAALTAVLNALGYTPANKAGDGFSGDITAVNITAAAAMTAGSFAGGSTSLGDPSVKGLNVGTDGFAVTGGYNGSGAGAYLNPSEYRGGSSSVGTPSVLGLNVGTNGIAIVGGPLSGVTGVFTSTVQAASQFISTIADGVSAVFAIDPAQANVAVPNLKAAKATTADTANAIADGAVSTTAKLADSTVTSAKIVDGTIVDGDVAAANKDGTTATPSLRTLGTGASQAAAGNHTHTAMAVVASGSYTGNNSTHTDTSLSFQPKRMEFSFSGTNGAVIMASGLGFNFANGISPIILTGTTFTANGFSTTNFIANGVVYSWTAWA